VAPFISWRIDAVVRIGITGGIGSGKTTVCKIWEREGAYVIYADDLAKQIMTDDSTVVTEIKAAFGADSYFADGTLNRSYLAKMAFGENRVGELNAIVHPAVYRESERLMQQAESDGYPMAVREAAILLQHGRPTDLDKVVLVLADKDSRRDRVVSRDGTPADQVLNRMGAQPDYEMYIPLADVVIRNDGSLEELKDKAIQIYRQLV
jgi:dephospho-CoA kinase